ncbi:transketolase [soil metagenome]
MAAQTVEQQTAQRVIDTVRGLAMDAVQTAGAGHPGTAMALAPLGYLLYTSYLRVSPEGRDWPDRDRFVLSAGHACILQYALLHLTGFPLALDELRRFRQWGSAAPGHPELGVTPGVEATTGPLGQGFANAVGMAIAERFLGERFNRPGRAVVDHHTYVIASDGDLMEGISSEAASIAGDLGLGKLVVCYDDNRITIDGTTAIAFDTEDKPKRFEAYGWHVQRVGDANDLGALTAALDAARAEAARPSLIAIRSHIGYPAPNAQDTAAAHGAPLGDEEVAETKRVLGLDPDATFGVPDDVYERMDLRARGRELERRWRERFDEWSRAHPRLRAGWDQAWSRRPGDGFADALPTFGPGEELATRAAGKQIMNAFARHVPTMVGGAADLAESTKTEFDGGGTFSCAHAGRNIAFGVREHAMGGIVNGLALHGGMVKPYGSTFLIFSDYMRPSVRLSALMELPVVWVWTHDSIGLGEDGPTHQPVEHYAALRAIPSLWVIRPCDANETSQAWRVALERDDGPVALLLSRQKLPVFDRGQVAPADGLARGAYVLWDSDDSADPQLILIATGAEVWPAHQAALRLADGGVRVRVVSMPCVELFESQPGEYRDAVLPPGVRARMSIEPGVSLGWREWVGDGGDILSLERFGASAPGTTVLERLGFEPGTIERRAMQLLSRHGG